MNEVHACALALFVPPNQKNPLVAEQQHDVEEYQKDKKRQKKT